MRTGTSVWLFLRHDGPEQPDGHVIAGALGDVVGMVPLLTIDSLGYMCGGVFVLSYLRPVSVCQREPTPVVQRTA